jgi:plastocyanin
MKIVAAAAMGLLLLAAGCKSNTAASTPKSSYTAIDWSTAGTIQGTIHYAGTPPKPILIDMSQDPACALSPPNYTEGYVVHQGGFANVFVYVKSGLGTRVYSPPSQPVAVDQKGCRYIPHVVGVMAGQPLRFTNSDSTMHNIYIQPAVAGNQTVNLVQTPGSSQKPSEDEVTFPKPELMLPVRCNIHPWMQGFINVAANPFYAVSDATGHYVIRGVPPGTYTLAADQENLGEKTVTVTVGPKQTVTQDFTYGSTAAK